MAIRFVRNNTVLHQAIDMLPNPIPIPITARGGINDAAIATPASQTAIFFHQNDKKATNHEAKAIHRSTKVGCVLIAISLVISVKGRKSVSTKAMNTHPIILANMVHMDFPNRLLFHVLVANHIA
jgi:hypothetical protein